MAPAEMPGVRSWAPAVRRWPIWGLPARLLAFVLAVIILAAAAVAAAAALTPLRIYDLELFGVLLGCDVITVELTRRAGEPAGLTKDVHAVWELPLALLLPPLYALIAPVARIALTQWRVRRAGLPAGVHRRRPRPVLRRRLSGVSRAGAGADRLRRRAGDACGRMGAGGHRVRSPALGR